MAFCNMCGAAIPDNSTMCAACASRAAAAPPASAPIAVSTAGTSDNGIAAIAYFTLIPAVVFMVLEPYNKSRYVRYHAWQSLLFNVAWIALWIVLRTIVHIPLFGWLTILTWPVIIIGGFIVWLVLVLKASQGQMFKLPVLGDIAEKQAGAM